MGLVFGCDPVAGVEDEDPGVTSAGNDGSSAEVDAGTTSDPGAQESSGGESSGGESSGGESGTQAFRISGTVVANVAPGGNGIGTLYVGIVPSIDCFDGSSASTDVIANADLSAIGNAVAFTVQVPGGEADGSGWLLQVFLDDNNNALYETPDSGDMTRSPTGFEEEAGCFPLPALDGNDINGVIVELDHVLP